MMDIYEIMEMLPHRYPFLLVDKILEADKNHVKALKNVTINEPFFQGHFPGKPVMPGVLIVESMAQSAVALIVNFIENPKDYLFYFMKIDKVKFRKPVVPGDTIIHEITLEKERGTMVVIKGKSYVDGKLVCEGELTAMAVKREEK